jgi:CDGSH-type Zn-finger protein
MRAAPPKSSHAAPLPYFIGRPELTNSRLSERRSLLALALFSPLSLLGCGNSQDGTHVQAGDATKAEVKARAEMYKARALQKKQSASKRKR